jgi:hypothetical protein
MAPLSMPAIGGDVKSGRNVTSILGGRAIAIRKGHRIGWERHRVTYDQSSQGNPLVMSGRIIGLKWCRVGERVSELNERVVLV